MAALRSLLARAFAVFLVCITLEELSGHSVVVSAERVYDIPTFALRRALQGRKAGRTSASKPQIPKPYPAPLVWTTCMKPTGDLGAFLNDLGAWSFHPAMSISEEQGAPLACFNVTGEPDMVAISKGCTDEQQKVVEGCQAFTLFQYLDGPVQYCYYDHNDTVPGDAEAFPRESCFGAYVYHFDDWTKTEFPHHVGVWGLESYVFDEGAAADAAQG